MEIAVLIAAVVLIISLGAAWSRSREQSRSRRTNEEAQRRYALDVDADREPS